MAATLLGVTKNSATLDGKIPAEATNGSVTVFAFFQRVIGHTVGAPTGWTLSAVNGNGSAGSVWFAWKNTSAAEAGTTVTFTSSSTAKMGLYGLAFSGPDASKSLVANGAAANSTSVAAPGVASDTSDSAVIHNFMVQTGTLTWSTPSGSTYTALDAGNFTGTRSTDASSYTGRYLPAVAGGEANQSATLSSNNLNVGQSLRLDATASPAAVTFVAWGLPL